MLLDCVDLGRQHEIALGQAIDLVGEDRDLGLAPGKKDVWMVRLFLGDGAGAIHEIERFFEIGKLEGFVQMMLIDHFPARQLGFECVQGVALERGNAAFARYAGFFG